jgi:hypothetical protein
MNAASYESAGVHEHDSPDELALGPVLKDAWLKARQWFTPRRMLAVLTITLGLAYLFVAWRNAAFDVMLAANTLAIVVWKADRRCWFGAMFGFAVAAVFVGLRGWILVTSGMGNIALWGGLYFLCLGAIAGVLFAWNRKREQEGQLEVTGPMERLDDFGFLMALVLILGSAIAYFGLPGAVLGVLGIFAWSLRGHRWWAVGAVFVAWLVLLANASGQPSTYASLFLTAERSVAVSPNHAAIPQDWRAAATSDVRSFSAAGYTYTEFTLPEAAFLESVADETVQPIDNEMPIAEHSITPVAQLPRHYPMSFWRSVDETLVEQGYVVERYRKNRHERLVYDSANQTLMVESQLWYYGKE